ncbi:hypothetical protein GQ42DRAFT_28846 [Ramicandelaber brevisporus]|nr:hypothetical protein GQ42DRAFT_28846 [Ramicandelaber brevisporus]
MMPLEGMVPTSTARVVLLTASAALASVSYPLAATGINTWGNEEALRPHGDLAELAASQQQQQQQKQQQEKEQQRQQQQQHEQQQRQQRHQHQQRQQQKQKSSLLNRPGGRFARLKQLAAALVSSKQKHAARSAPPLTSTLTDRLADRLAVEQDALALDCSNAAALVLHALASVPAFAASVNELDVDDLAADPKTLRTLHSVLHIVRKLALGDSADRTSKSINNGTSRSINNSSRGSNNTNDSAAHTHGLLLSRFSETLGQPADAPAALQSILGLFAAATVKQSTRAASRNTLVRTLSSIVGRFKPQSMSSVSPTSSISPTSLASPVSSSSPSSPASLASSSALRAVNSMFNVTVATVATCTACGFSPPAVYSSAKMLVLPPPPSPHCTSPLSVLSSRQSSVDRICQRCSIAATIAQIDTQLGELRGQRASLVSSIHRSSSARTTISALSAIQKQTLADIEARIVPREARRHALERLAASTALAASIDAGAVCDVVQVRRRFVVRQQLAAVPRVLVLQFTGGGSGGGSGGGTLEHQASTLQLPRALQSPVASNISSQATLATLTTRSESCGESCSKSSRDESSRDESSRDEAVDCADCAGKVHAHIRIDRAGCAQQQQQQPHIALPETINIQPLQSVRAKPLLYRLSAAIIKGGHDHEDGNGHGHEVGNGHGHGQSVIRRLQRGERAQWVRITADGIAETGAPSAAPPNGCVVMAFYSPISKHA